MLLYYYDLEKVNLRRGKIGLKCLDKNEIAHNLNLEYSFSTPEIISSRLHPRNVIDWQTNAYHIANQKRNIFNQAICLNNIGLQYRILGEYQHAVKNYEVALKIAKKNKFNQILVISNKFRFI